MVEKGIQPIVITTHNHPTILTETSEGIEVHYLPVTYNNQYGFFRRVYSFLKFVLATVNYIGKFRDVRVCYAISTPLTTGVAALWIKFRYRISYFFEVGDLWPEAPIQLGFVKSPALKFILYTLEKFIYQQATAIVALSEEIKKDIEKKAPGKPIEVIPNMADTDFYKPEVKDLLLEKKYGTEKKFIVSYIGTLGVANGLDFLIDCARVAKRNALLVQFIVCGEGAERNRLQQLAKKLQLDNISFVGFLPRSGVKEILNVTDAVMVSFRPLNVLETGSPNKYFDGLAAGKLIISNVGGWIKKEIEENACGVFASATQPEMFCQTIQPFIMDAERLKQYQSNARKLAEERYARKLLSKAFQQLF